MPAEDYYEVVAFLAFEAGEREKEQRMSKLKRQKFGGR